MNQLFVAAVSDYWNVSPQRLKDIDIATIDGSTGKVTLGPDINLENLRDIALPCLHLLREIIDQAIKERT